MHWKLKAKIQNAISRLPPSASYAAYYWMQRRFGALRRYDPTSRLTAGIETWKRIERHGCSPAGKVFFEVGTGRVPVVPMAFWLLGAEKTISVDLNPYLKKELIGDALEYIAAHDEEIANLFGGLLDTQRFAKLLEFSKRQQFDASEFLELCRVEYIAPGDASATGLPERSIDFHTSYTVFEHIPPEVLRRILEEGNRIIQDEGLFVHRIDYSDHFSHSDERISPINFLEYSDREWEKYADNRYMYMNRLRHDDFVSLFESVGHRIVEAEPDVNRRVQELLKRGDMRLDDRFRSKPEEVLCITAAWMITLRKGEQASGLDNMSAGLESGGRM